MICLFCNIILKCNFLQTYYRQTFHKLQTESYSIVLGCEFLPLIPGWKGTLLLCVHYTTQNPHSSPFLSQSCENQQDCLDAKKISEGCPHVLSHDKSRHCLVRLHLYCTMVGYISWDTVTLSDCGQIQKQIC
jgi:hypothetical protein